MKRYIKSSFGYEDSDWVDPDDLDQYENREILIEFDNDQVSYNNDALEFKSRVFKDFYDEENDTFVADGTEIEEYVLEALDPYLPQFYGDYKLSGWVSIPYQISIPYKGYMHRRDWEELESEAEIIGKPVSGNIKFEVM